MSLSSIIYNFLLNFIYACLMYTFLKSILEVKIRSKYSTVLLLSIQALVLQLLNMNWDIFLYLSRASGVKLLQAEVPIFDGIPFLTLLFVIFCLSAPLYIFSKLFNCTLIKLISGILHLCVLALITEIMSNIISHILLFVPQNVSLDLWWQKIFREALRLIFLYTFIKALSRIKVSTSNLKKVYIYEFVIILVFNLIALATVKNLGNITSENVYIYVIALAEVAFSILTIKIIDQIIKYSKKETEWSLREKDYEMQARHIKNMEELYYKLKAQRHDFNNHMGCIYGLLESGKIPQAKEYAENLIQSTQEINSIITVDNAVVASLLNYKLALAKEKNNYVTFKIDSLKNSDIDPTDISIVLGNALDNAIEASEKSEHRLIDIEMKLNGDYLVIKISNSKKGQAIKKDELFKSTKKDGENHGFGLANIKYVVEKYKGFLQIHDEENTFRLNAALKNGS